MLTYYLYSGVWYSPSSDRVVLVQESISTYDSLNYLSVNVEKVITSGQYIIDQDCNDWERVGDF